VNTWWCWKFAKVKKLVKKRWRNQARGAAWVALPPLGRCPPVPGSEQQQWRWSWPVTVYTVMCRAVRHHKAYGATAAFFPRMVSLDLSAGGHRHGDGGAPPYFSREVVSQGASWVVAATPRVVPPPPLSGDQQLIRPLGWAPPCPVPSQKPAALLQRLYLAWGYK
jgi:hypothetical protein